MGSFDELRWIRPSLVYMSRKASPTEGRPRQLLQRPPSGCPPCCLLMLLAIQKGAGSRVLIADKSKKVCNLCACRWQRGKQQPAAQVSIKRVRASASKQPGTVPHITLRCEVHVYKLMQRTSAAINKLARTCMRSTGLTGSPPGTLGTHADHLPHYILMPCVY